MQELLTCPYCGSHEIECTKPGYRCKKCGRVFSDEDLETLSNRDYDNELKKRYDASKWR